MNSLDTFMTLIIPVRVILIMNVIIAKVVFKSHNLEMQEFSSERVRFHHVSSQEMYVKPSLNYGILVVMCLTKCICNLVYLFTALAWFWYLFPVKWCYIFFKKVFSYLLLVLVIIMGSCISGPKFDKEKLSKAAQPKPSKTKSRSSKEHAKELRNKNVRSKKPTSSGSHLDEDVSIEDMVKIYPENMGNQLNKKLQKEQPQPQVVSKVYQTAKPVATTSVLKTLPSTSSQNLSGNTEPYIYLPSNTNLRKSESPIKNDNFKGSNTQTTLSSGLKATLPPAKSHSINNANKNIRPGFNMYESSDIPPSKLLEVKINDNPNEQVSPRQCVVNVDNLPRISYPSIHLASDLHDSFSIIQETGTRPQSLLEIAKPFSDKIILNQTKAPRKLQRNVGKIEPTARDMSGLQMTYLAHSTTLSEPRYFCEPAQSSSKIHDFKLRDTDNFPSVNSHFLPTIQASQNVPNIAHSTSVSISPNICKAVEYSEGFIKEPFDAIGKQKRDAVTSCISNKEAIELPVNSIVPAAAAQVSITDILQGIQQRSIIYEEKPQQQNLDVLNQTQSHSAYSLLYPYTNDVKPLKDTAEDSVNTIEESVPKKEVLIKVNISQTKQEEKPYEQTITYTKQLIHTAEDSRISPVTKIKESEKEVPIELTISEKKQEEKPYETDITDTNIKSLSGYETPRYHKEEQIPFKRNDKGKTQQQRLDIPNQSQTYSAYSYTNDVKQLIDTAEDSRISPVTKMKENEKEEIPSELTISETKQEEKPYETDITDTNIKSLSGYETPRYHKEEQIPFKRNDKGKPQQQRLDIPNQSQTYSAYSYTNDVKQLIDTAEDSRISPVTKMKENEKEEIPSELTISETKQEEKPYETDITDTNIKSLSGYETPRYHKEEQIPFKRNDKGKPQQQRLDIPNQSQTYSAYSYTNDVKQLIDTAEDSRISPVTKMKENEKEEIPSELTISETKQEEKPYETDITDTNIKSLSGYETPRYHKEEQIPFKRNDKGKPQQQRLDILNQSQTYSAYSYTNDVKQLIDTAEDSRISPVTKMKENEKEEIPSELTISETKQEEKPYETDITDTNIKSLSGYETPRYHKEEQIPFKRNDKGKPQQQRLDILNQSQTYSAYSYTNDVKQLIDTAEDSRISPVTKMKENEKEEIPSELTISETKQEEKPYETDITDTNIKSLSGYETPRYHKEEQIPFKRNDKGKRQQQRLDIPNQSQTYSAYSYTNDVKQLIDTAEDSRISPVTKMKENEKEEIPSELTISETKQEENPYEQTSIDTVANLLSGYETERYHKEDTNLQSVQDGDILEFNPIQSVSSKAILNKAREENSHAYPQQTMSARSLYSNENNEKYLTEVQNTPNKEYLTEVQNTPKNKVKENENITILKKTSVEKSYEYSQQMISSASSTYSHELSFSGPIIESSQEEYTNKPNSKQTYQEESFEIRIKQHDENHNGISTFSRDSGKNFKEFVSGMLNESEYDYYNSNIAYEDQNWQQYHDNAYHEEYQIPEMQVPDTKFDKEIHCEKSGDDNDSDLLLFFGNQPPIQDNTVTKEDITLSSTRLLRGLCLLDKEAVEIQQDDRIGPEKKDETNSQTTQERVKGEPQTVDEPLAYGDELFRPQVSNERQLTKQGVNKFKPSTTQENNNIPPEFTLEIAPQDEPEPHQRTEHNERHLKHQISQQVNNSGSQGYIDSELNLVIAPQDELESHQPTEDNERHLILLLDAGTGNQISQQLYNSVICSFDEIKRKAEPFEEEIRNFTELEDSDKHYYIEESLRRLIDKLDDMSDDIGNVKLLREERKKVYRFIFPMFERLDEKVKENRERKEWERDDVSRLNNI